MSKPSQECAIVDNIAGDMKRRLRENGHKEWKDLSAIVLYKKMINREAITKLRNVIYSDNPDEIKKQCADVANFCAMISDVV